LTVRDTSGVVVPYEDFEDEPPGAVEADDWKSYPAAAYGDYAGLYPGYALEQEDPCLSRSGCMWAFIKGSTVDYACGGHPDQITVPYVDENDRYIRNHVVSPDIAVAGAGSRWELRFDVYRDLDLDALVFYEWFVRPVDAQGCPGPWQNDGFVYYGGWKDWYTAIHGVGQYIDAGAAYVNVSLGARDMCEFWCGYYGMGHCHSHAPLFDNVSLYRIDHSGPVWSGRDIDMFQDNFPGDGTVTGAARADMARDILPGASPGILPGDSVAITVSDPGAGLGFHVPGDTSSGAAVYLYCSIDGPHSGATGGDLVVDDRYNYIGTVAAGGRTWFQIQMDSTFTGSGDPVAGRYNVDLNDNFFVPGDTVWFFFGAAGTGGKSTYWALPLPTPANETDDIEEAAANPDEFTILPAQALHSYGEWLYVDGMNFRSAQPFFDTAFEQLTIFDGMDRYDIRGPSSAVGNHPGSRVNSFFQLAGVYMTIIWNTGDLSTAFGDGSGYPDKSDDTGLLLGFLENRSGSMGGVYLCGDDVADVWINSLTSTSATSLRTKYIDFSLVANNHVPAVGVTPLGVGEPGSMFGDALGPDTVVVYGGCPVINDFDIVAPVGPTVVQMQYHGGGNTAGAIVSDTTTNPVGNTVGFVLSGFSFHNIRDHATGVVMDRTVHMHRILSWIGSLPVTPIPVGPRRVARNELRQNYPNPFNPATTIRYQVAKTGPVTLKVYNVAGQRVRTLMDGTARAGEVHEVRWRGLNDAGGPVASGVYFYRLVAGGFVETRKMVLLK
jgi:hypothetical protein